MYEVLFKSTLSFKSVTSHCANFDPVDDITVRHIRSKDVLTDPMIGLLSVSCSIFRQNTVKASWATATTHSKIENLVLLRCALT